MLFRLLVSFAMTLTVLSSSLTANAEEVLPEEGFILKQMAPKVYIDCNRCDNNYIRTEITYVNYVRDPRDAQVYVMITTQSTGSRGTEYTLEFNGSGDFEGTDNTLKYVTGNMDTSDEIREGLVNILKLGLAPYAARTPIAKRMNVSYAGAETEESEEVDDKWDYWIFSLSGRASFDGEKRSRAYSFNGSFSANRVTEGFKFRASYSGNRSTDRFYYGDSKIVSTSKRHNFEMLAVKSISDHWSVGAGLGAYSNTYSNIKFAFMPAPAVEFNIFPYSESTRRQLRFLWKPAFRAYYYREETIYDKTEERLWGEEFSAAFEIKEQWGTASTGFEVFHYFHDPGKNHIRINGDLSIRLFKGLSFNIYGSFQRIRDQLSLIKGDASLEEVLLRRTQLETNYSYYGQVGLSYTFGSIYSNVVNPRFYGY